MTEPLLSPVFELRQTREFTSREKRDLTSLWRKLLWRDEMGSLFTMSGLYTMLGYLWYGFGAFLGLAILAAVKTLWVIMPNLSVLLALSGLGFALSLVAAYWASGYLSREKYWMGRRVGDRYAIHADGINATLFRGDFQCRWNHIETLINNDKHLVAALPGTGGLFIVKAAFENQDVETFGAELARCWQDHRAATATGSST